MPNSPNPTPSDSSSQDLPENPTNLAYDDAEQGATPRGATASEIMKRRIRIGSQRSIADRQRHQPTPRPAPLSPKGPDVPSGQPPRDEPAPQDPPAVEAGGPLAVESPGEQGLPTDTQSPTHRTQQSPAKLQPRPAPVATPRSSPAPVPPAPTAKVPPPSIRGQLSAELEREVADALGGMSLDDVLVGGDTSRGAEAPLEPETRVSARVLSVSRENVFFDLGGRNEGIVPLQQFAEPPAQGATIDVIVQRFNAEEGLFELNIPGAAVHVGDWSEVSEGIIVDAVVSGHNKGGLECEVSRIRGFIPASQIALYRVENFDQFVGQKLSCVVIEANPEKRNLVLSPRAAQERQRAAQRDALLASLAVGQTHEGVVRKVLDFGAFVDLGGVDALVPVGQMSWERIKHPSDVLAEGQKIQVRIERVDPDSQKISLSYRQCWENPWDKAAAKYTPGSRVQGTVTRLADFGAFVKLEPGIEGLIHISELSHKRVSRASHVLSEGQQVEVQIVSVDPEAQRIGLSLKALQARDQPLRKADEPEEPEGPLEPTLPKRNEPLRGGVDRPSGGAKLGLKW